MGVAFLLRCDSGGLVHRRKSEFSRLLVAVHADVRTGQDASLENLHGQRVLNEALNGAAQRPRAIGRVEALAEHSLASRLGQLEGNLAAFELFGCLRPSGLKKTISSTRLRNSGRKVARSASMASARAFAGSVVPSSTSAVEPTLLVMTMTELRKFTTRPFPSVRRPSSRIWRRTLNTSGWAFSISSSRTTA